MQFPTHFNGRAGLEARATDSLIKPTSKVSYLKSALIPKERLALWYPVGLIYLT